jgi:hypothetical protein
MRRIVCSLLPIYGANKGFPVPGNLFKYLFFTPQASIFTLYNLNQYLLKQNPTSCSL